MNLWPGQNFFSLIRTGQIMVGPDEVTRGWGVIYFKFEINSFFVSDIKINEYYDNSIWLDYGTECVCNNFFCKLCEEVVYDRNNHNNNDKHIKLLKVKEIINKHIGNCFTDIKWTKWDSYINILDIDESYKLSISERILIEREKYR